MAKKTISCISGVLGELISPEPENKGATPKESLAPRQRIHEVVTPETPPAPRRPRARVGRPPASNALPTSSKEKVTLRIPSDLIAEYRDWSWEARCQLGELVERALTARRRRRPS